MKIVKIHFFPVLVFTLLIGKITFAQYCEQFTYFKSNATFSQYCRTLESTFKNENSCLDSTVFETKKDQAFCIGIRVSGDILADCTQIAEYLGEDIARIACLGFKWAHSLRPDENIGHVLNSQSKEVISLFLGHHIINGEPVGAAFNLSEEFLREIVNNVHHINSLPQYRNDLEKWIQNWQHLDPALFALGWISARETVDFGITTPSSGPDGVRDIQDFVDRIQGIESRFPESFRFSELASSEGITGMVHETSGENLIKILETEELRPRGLNGSTPFTARNKNLVYLRGVNKNSDYFLHYVSGATLVFSPRLLDQYNDFRMTLLANAGEHTLQDSSIYSDRYGRLKLFFHKIGNEGFDYSNEFLFPHPVNLENLVSIKIKKEIYRTLLEDSKASELLRKFESKIELCN